MNMMKNLRDQLLNVDPEKLVDALFEIASNDKIAKSKIERLLSSEKENFSRFKKHLQQIKNRRGQYFSRRDVESFAIELCELLNNLKKVNIDFKEAFNHICDFYRADGKILEQSDDSNGDIGDIFRNEALDLFIEFASKHSNRKHVLATVAELHEGDDYGARNEIIQNSYRFLNIEEMRELFSIFEAATRKKIGKYTSNWEMQSLAKQMKDASLFEKLIYQSSNEPNTRMLIEIAEVYFSSGNITKAQEFLNLIPRKDTSAIYEREKLQKEIFKHTSNNEALYNLLHQAFKRRFSESTLNELVCNTGEEKRNKFIQEALNEIKTEKKWHSHNAEFLVSVNEAEYLENYIFAHLNEINGDHYHNLLGIIKYLEKNSKFLAATILYRSLIDSILKRAQSKYYHHGVKYLKNIDKLSIKIVHWKGFDPHNLYLQNLKIDHKLKRSFWGQYTS